MHWAFYSAGNISKFIRNVVLKFDLEVPIHYTSLSVEIVYYVVIHHRRADSPFAVKWVFQKY